MKTILTAVLALLLLILAPTSTVAIEPDTYRDNPIIDHSVKYDQVAIFIVGLGDDSIDGVRTRINQWLKANKISIKEIRLSSTNTPQTMIVVTYQVTDKK